MAFTFTVYIAKNASMTLVRDSTQPAEKRWRLKVACLGGSHRTHWFSRRRDAEAAADELAERRITWEKA